MSDQITPHFAYSDFATPDPVPAALRPRTERLARELEVLRHALGDRPIIITSGYRSPEHNEEVGGKSNSQHMQAAAADFYVPGLSALQVWCTAEKMMARGVLKNGGLGWYGNQEGQITHYDVRDYSARWYGQNNELSRPSCIGVTLLPAPPFPEEDDDMRYLAATVDGTYMRVITSGPQGRWVTKPDEDAYWRSVVPLEDVDPDVLKGILGR